MHLEDLRCDGSAHGGCQAGCLLYWKEAWLTRGVETDTEDADARRTERTADAGCPRRRDTWRRADPHVTRARTAGRSTRARPPSFYARRRRPVNWWELGQYVEDVSSGNASVGQCRARILVGFFNKFQQANAAAPAAASA